LVIFPLLSLATFTIFMDTNNTVLFKWLVISGNVLWFVHDIFIMSYVAVAFDILGTITKLIGIYRIKKEKSPPLSISLKPKKSKVHRRGLYSFLLSSFLSFLSANNSIPH
jgi:hypothetical protein